MRVEFNPLVEQDISAAADWYREAGGNVAARFLSELRLAFEEIGEHPERFHFDATEWRRFNMRGFPYHILFREKAESIRVMAVRHNRQSPDRGINRK
ncbi:type II toxin-antitoxin system RelE/ParE family toxin [Luteolibacter sp. GHJ8]|jgi:toxin ParE1/3/4|uniref:Type II toxin-antitoxin system RelE/ParE family toxin n=1 Tax=Luteolibacter rhizosphaerae TaxID=2989719 RepID=A0ABT3G425_9BACT|nr:type II toxin-antitoxin system RelE/ParE family toxin [Luteolibacter rhizosphaerae]MCW1914304.1 type II toxin-antitoxin system RelE/ParE family toxin [Luteolibacter rhizosphaerae]